MAPSSDGTCRCWQSRNQKRSETARNMDVSYAAALLRRIQGNGRVLPPVRLNLAQQPLDRRRGLSALPRSTPSPWPARDRFWAARSLRSTPRVGQPGVSPWTDGHV